VSAFNVVFEYREEQNRKLRQITSVTQGGRVTLPKQIELKEKQEDEKKMAAK